MDVGQNYISSRHSNNICIPSFKDCEQVALSDCFNVQHQLTLSVNLQYEK